MKALGNGVVEKLPNTAPPPEGHELKGRRVVRWVKMVSAEGHILRCPLTPASSDYNVNAPYGQAMRAKWRNLGWIPYGECPIASREVIKDKLLVAENREFGTPCEPGTFDNGEGKFAKGCCKHVAAEIEARRKRNDEKTKQHQSKYETEASASFKAQAKASEANAGALTQMSDMLQKLMAVQLAGLPADQIAKVNELINTAKPEEHAPKTLDELAAMEQDEL